jgi:hypothetical protein
MFPFPEKNPVPLRLKHIVLAVAKCLGAKAAEVRGIRARLGEVLNGSIAQRE